MSFGSAKLSAIGPSTFYIATLWQLHSTFSSHTTWVGPRDRPPLSLPFPLCGALVSHGGYSDPEKGLLTGKIGVLHFSTYFLQN
ncbi:hypothetical protein HZ326_28187 [Fusarium oxysporum f. sp. albedinis]|nr:hypothetical protein HZ326_28187 [Fusarium oxysporum f. sp. albedinis]